MNALTDNAILTYKKPAYNVAIIPLGKLIITSTWLKISLMSNHEMHGHQSSINHTKRLGCQLAFKIRISLSKDIHKQYMSLTVQTDNNCAYNIATEKLQKYYMMTALAKRWQ